MAASEIHKAGQQGSKAAKILFANMGFGALHVPSGRGQRFLRQQHIPRQASATLGKKLLLRTSTNPNVATTVTGGATIFTAPDVSPAYLGVGYIIGPRLAALNFAGGVLAWGLLVPLLTFVLGPSIQASQPAGSRSPGRCWPMRSISRSCGRSRWAECWWAPPTLLFKMRKQLGVGMARAISDLKKSAAAHAASNRTERDLSAKVVFAGVGAGVRGDDRAVLLLHRRRGESYEFEGHRRARWSRRW